MKRLSFFLGLLLLCLCGSAQNPAWTIPANYVRYIGTSSFAIPGLPVPATYCGSATPNSPNLIYDGYDGQLPQHASNMMLNRDGSVKFFIVDGVVYDGEGNYIDELWAGGTVAKGASETVIVPDPSNCNRFYIITVRIKTAIYEKLPFVFLLDMSLRNENGCGDCEHYGALVPQTCPGSSIQDVALAVECVNPASVPPDPSPGKISNCFIAASKLQPGGFYWVFISNSYGIFRYRIDANGFSDDNHYISFGNGAFNPFDVRSEMELASLPGGGFRLATVYKPDGMTAQGVWEYLYVVDLDANADAIISTEKRFPMNYYNPNGINLSPFIKGIEFSRNGERVYVTHNTSPDHPDQMEYYDFSNPTVALVPFNIPSSIDAQFSMLELRSDDKLILANQNGLYQIPNAATSTGSISQMWALNYAPTYEGSFVSNSMKMYMLPDQIDGMDYEAYMVATLACCIESNVYDAEKYSAASGTWQVGGNPLVSGTVQDIYIREELRVPAGVSLTITGMNLRFAPGARLVIENGTGVLQGGQLTLNSTLLTVDDRCSNDETWLGVEVWGNTNSPQGTLSNSSQGRLYVQSGSRIEHALAGVLVGKRKEVEIPQSGCPSIFEPQAFTFDYAFSGGIVRTTDASFFGNQRGVWFLPYLASNGANNLSQISTTDFYWDGPLRGGLSPQAHAHLNSVKGVIFRGSSFRNANPSAFSYTQLGTGIYSYKAQFHVQTRCLTLVPPCTACPGEIRSSFENLRFGIRTYNPGQMSFTVTKSDFNNCQYGMYVQYTKSGQITKNRFNVRQESYQTAGIALYSAPTFTVEENDIEGIGSATGSNSYGIVVNNSGTADNDIYLNEFSNLHIAGQSESVNAVAITASNEPGSNFNMSGLNWTCNDFESGIDLADLTVVNGRIDYFQGHAIGHSSLNDATLGSARNRFSLHGESPALGHDITQSGTSIQELQYVGLNTPHYWVDSYSTNWVLPLFSSYNGTLATATSSMCPSRCNGDKQSKYELRTSMLSEIENLESQLTGSSRLSQDEIDALESRLRLVKEQLNLLENQLVADALAAYESLSELESELFELGASQVFADLEQTFAQDLSIGQATVTLGEPDEFFPIEPANAPRKTSGLEAAAGLQFKVYPNPSQGQLEIAFEATELGQVDVQVVDLMGRTVHAQSVDTNSNTKIDLSHLSSGMYNLLVRNGSEMLGSRKFELNR